MFSPQFPILPALSGCRSLADALVQSSAQSEGRGIRLIQSARMEERLSYAGLHDRALSMLGALQSHGVQPGDALVLVTDDLALFTAVFWAGALGGVVTVPIAVPANEAGHTKLGNVLDVLGPKAWLASDNPQGVAARLSDARLPAARRLTLSRECFDAPPGQPHAQRALDDAVLIQFSSGSTGQPKGVQITSRNLLANASGIADRCALSAERDHMLNWMPLTHDFGIVFCHVMPTVLGVEQALIATPTFMRHPLLWMQKASDLGATVSAGPNYAYHHFLKRYKPEAALNWDLSRLRAVINGAEPISCELSRQFFHALARHGLSPQAATPGYGLAEATLMVTLCTPEAPFRSIRLDRRHLAPGATVVETDDEAQALEFASAGPVGRNIELRITDAHRQALPDGCVGTIETRSACVTPGYHGRPELTAQMISADGWLDTGDLGFVRQGDLYITGRRKDLVIINGVNYYPHDIEAVAAQVPPLDLNAVAACAVPVPRQDREGLALFIRSREDGAAFEQLAERLRDHVLQHMGLPVDHCLAVRQIPKTTSGKVQRFLLVQQFQAGEYDDQIAAAQAHRTRSDLRQAWDRGDAAALLRALKAEAARLAPQADWADPQIVHTPMMELGLGSLRLVELLNRINASLELELPVSTVFDHPSLDSWVQPLLAQRPSATLGPAELAAGTGEHAPASVTAPIRSPVTAADPASSSVAIIGMACRFPGQANAPEAFWQLLLEGRDATGPFPAGRWDSALNAQARTDRGAYLEDLDHFDHRFFRLTPAEAQALDPQQRLLLTVSWEAFEHAGLDPHRLRGSNTGVYTGICGSDYAQAQARGGPLEDIGPYAFTGSATRIASGRLSFFYGLEGPNLAIDTACSSALAAVHQAVRALRSGECDLALASAVNLILSPEMQVGLTRLNALSPDGRCKAFDASANGYARGEGCAGVVLKRLADAQADGDPILAVIRGSAMNHDGASNGLTAPNGAAQQKVIAAALRDARIDPADVDYVEAHGTGTALGDPVEAVALAAVYGRGRAAERPLRIGSVKTNVAHLEAAAGMASLFKVVMALQHRQWPATLHLREPNPMIAWEQLPLQVVDRLQPWPAREDGAPLRAGISAFGMSGTNVHLLLQEAPIVAERDAPQGDKPAATAEASADAAVSQAPALLLLSARTESALVAQARQMGRWLEDHPQGLHDMARTLGLHRAKLPVRLGLAGTDPQAMTASLLAVQEEGRPPTAGGRSAVFVFPGQGSQAAGALESLWASEPVVRRSLEQSQAALAGELNLPLIPLLLQGDAATLERTEYTQVAAVATGLALWDLWQSWGLQATALVGHSVGEIAAAAAAGAIGREAALVFAARRGALMQRLQPGAMLSVSCSPEQLRALLADLIEPGASGPGISVAAVNGSRSLTLAGSLPALAAAETRLAQAGIRHTRLAVSHAFHSAMLDPLEADLLSLAASRLQPQEPQIPLFSCVTGQAVDRAALAAPDFWWRHARQTVRFHDVISALMNSGDPAFIELGARPVFASLAALEWPSALWMGSALSRRSMSEGLLHALAQAHEAGFEFNREAVFASQPGRRIRLPAYPFQGTTPMLSTVRTSSPGVAGLNAAEAPVRHAQSSTLALAAPAAQETGAAERAFVRDKLRSLVCKISGLQADEVLPQANWFALGLDSLLVLQLQQALNKALAVDVKLNDIFEQGTTLDDLTELVMRHGPRVGAAGVSGSAASTAATAASAAAMAPVGSAVMTAPALPSGMPTQPAAPAWGSAPPGISWPDGAAARPMSAGSDLEALLTAQVDALSRLFQQQLAVLQGATSAASPSHSAAHPTPPQITPTHTTPAAPATTLAASPSPTATALAQPSTPEASAAAKPASEAPKAEIKAEIKGLYRQIPGRKAQWSEARVAHVRALAQAYVARTPGSKAATEEGREVYANPRAVIGFRPEWKEMTYPLHVSRAEGAHVWDVDGNRYVDITMGFGATLFGHNPAFIRQALMQELEQGAPLGPQTPHALDAARLIADMTGAQRVGFFTTGSEAVMVAVRLARAVTHRQRIVIFTNAYHGTFDGFLAMGWVDEGRPQTYPLADGTPPKMVEDVVVLRYGDPKALDIIRGMAEQLAAVLVEPVQSRDPSIQPREFLHELRHITQASGSALIFDEMIMGFRVHPGGAQHHFGIQADICTYGKIVGGGMPIGVVAGQARFLDAIDGGQWHYGDDSVPSTRTAFVAGTFNSHPLSMVAAKAVLQHLQESGPALQEALNARTAALAARLNALFEAEQAPIRCVHFSSLFRFEFADDSEVLNYHLLTQGVFVWEGRNCFLSTAHSDQDIDFIVEAVAQGLRAMRDSGYLQPAAAAQQVA